MTLNFTNEFVKFEIVNDCGVVTLTRPQSLNALNYEMVDGIVRQLVAWRDDATVGRVLITAMGERAFCAGGDIALLARGLPDIDDMPRYFLHYEYQMNALIAQYPKPIIALMHGVCMGGGIGLAGHARHRVVFNSSKLAMPEVAIGFITDVGGSYLLARAPHRLGYYLGLTAMTMDGHSALYTNFADLHAGDSTPQEIADLVIHKGIEGLYAQLSGQTLGESMLQKKQALLEKAFAKDSLPEIYAELEKSQDEFAQEILAKMAKNSPLSMRLVADLLNRNHGQSLRESLKVEYRVAYRMGRHSEFKEGVRAQIIDKDKNPKWGGLVDIEPFFAPLAEELTFIS